MRHVALTALLLLAACAQPVPIVDETSRAPLDDAPYRQAARAGATVYRIEPQASRILVHVGRAGAMKNLGHDHAVASEDVQGYVAIAADPAASHASLIFPVRNLLVDDSADRARLGLGAGPDADDVAGTYTNMLKVLGPALYPWVRLDARIVDQEDAHRVTLSVSVTLHGTTAEMLVPVELEIDAGRLTASGHATLHHSDFGMSPYTAAGGLLRVADELDIRFRFVGAATDFSGTSA